MFERFTDQAREIVIGAQDEARALGHESIGTEHLLLSMLHHEVSVAYEVLTRAGLRYASTKERINTLLGLGGLGPEDAAALSAIGIDLAAVQAKMAASFGPDQTTTPGQPKRHIPFSRRAKKVLELSLREAVRLKHRYIGSEHVLLGLIREGEGLAAKAIVDSGVALSDLRAATEAAIVRAA